MPMVLAAPARFSATMVWPIWRPTWSNTRRAVTSSALPGVFDMMTWIGCLAGHSCAAAMAGIMKSASIPGRRILRIAFPFFFQGVNAHRLDQSAGRGRTLGGAIHEGEFHFGRGFGCDFFERHVGDVAVCHGRRNRRNSVAERDVGEHRGQILGALGNYGREAAQFGDGFDMPCKG